MKIIQHATRKFETELSREFRWKDDWGAGFIFDCDRDGNAINLKSDYARENWEGCISGRFAVVDLGIEKRENSWLEPAVGRCDCAIGRRSSKLANHLDLTMRPLSGGRIFSCCRFD